MTPKSLLAAIKKKQPLSSDADVLALERSVGEVFPEDYREFLIACNGGFAGGVRSGSKGQRRLGKLPTPDCITSAGFAPSRTYHLLGGASATTAESRLTSCGSWTILSVTPSV